MKVRITLRESSDQDVTSDKPIVIAVDANTGALSLYETGDVGALVAAYAPGVWLTARRVTD